MLSSSANPQTLDQDASPARTLKTVTHTGAEARRLVNPWAPVRLWHLASLDAPTVAVAWTLGFAWAAGVHLQAWVPVLIALGSWAVYIGDRLVDARSAMRSGMHHRLRERHFFHWRHRRFLLPACVGSSCAAASILLLYVPAPVGTHDSVLALAALAYFSGVHARPIIPVWARRIVSKELLVGVLFTAGCAIPALSRIPVFPGVYVARFSILAATAFFAALAWLNCHAIDAWESEFPPRVAKYGVALATVGLLSATLLAPMQVRAAALMAAGAFSALLIALLDRVRTRLAPLALRAAADLVLLTPLLFALRRP